MSPWLRPGRRFSVSARGTVAAALLAACSITPPTPETPTSLDEAIARTMNESGIAEARQVLRVPGWVLVTGTRELSDVLLLLSVQPQAPWSVSVEHESVVRVSDPATLSDAAPVRRTFGVAPPGYLVERPGAAPPDPILAWRFLDAAGAVVVDPAASPDPAR